LFGSSAFRLNPTFESMMSVAQPAMMITLSPLSFRALILQLATAIRIGRPCPGKIDGIRLVENHGARPRQRSHCESNGDGAIITETGSIDADSARLDQHRPFRNLVLHEAIEVGRRGTILGHELERACFELSRIAGVFIASTMA
jgi:hypothetical protein